MALIWALNLAESVIWQKAAQVENRSCEAVAGTRLGGGEQLNGLEDADILETSVGEIQPSFDYGVRFLWGALGEVKCQVELVC